LTPSNVEPFNIDTGTERPVNVPPRRVPPAHRLEIEKQLKAAGLIACDYRPLNKRTIPDRYPLTNIEEAFLVMGGNEIFSTIDLKSGFFQVPLTDDLKPQRPSPIHLSSLWSSKRTSTL
jgi:hypothetical protein